MFFLVAYKLHRNIFCKITEGWWFFFQARHWKKFTFEKQMIQKNIAFFLLMNDNRRCMRGNILNLTLYGVFFFETFAAFFLPGAGPPPPFRGPIWEPLVFLYASSVFFSVQISTFSASPCPTFPPFSAQLELKPFYHLIVPSQSFSFFILDHLHNITECVPPLSLHIGTPIFRHIPGGGCTVFPFNPWQLNVIVFGDVAAPRLTIYHPLLFDSTPPHKCPPDQFLCSWIRHP